MKEKQDNIDRRNFLKAAATTGLAHAFAKVTTGYAAEDKAGPDNSKTKETDQEPKPPQVPTRKLGKTNVEIPCLTFGTFQVDVANQILLRKTLQWGVNSWDTAHNYGYGNSELGIGKFLAKNPKVRKNLLLITKASDAQTADDVESRLMTSLKRMNTDYIDLYYGIHKCPDPSRLTNELKRWAENAKKRKLIKLFGVTTHQNMARILAAVAKLDWIDVVMTSYNFRLMQDTKLNAAIDACHKAGVGIVAMKTQGTGQNIRTDADKKLVGYFLKRGFTEAQAKIKAVLQDKRIASACVGMKNVKVLNENVAAAMDKIKLTQADMQALNEYAQATCTSYCVGCSHICDSALPDPLRPAGICDTMRYLMYYNSYGQKAQARHLFAQIPATVRNGLLKTDYSLAESRCPQHLPIARLVAEAVSKLA